MKIKDQKQPNAEAAKVAQKTQKKKLGTVYFYMMPRRSRGNGQSPESEYTFDAIFAAKSRLQPLSIR